MPVCMQAMCHVAWMRIHAIKQSHSICSQFAGAMRICRHATISGSRVRQHCQFAVQSHASAIECIDNGVRCTASSASPQSCAGGAASQRLQSVIDGQESCMQSVCTDLKDRHATSPPLDAGNCATATSRSTSRSPTPSPTTSRTGRLAPRDRLPPQRKLAERLDIDFTTVARGYVEAQKRGLVDSRVGRGTFVLRAPGRWRSRARWPGGRTSTVDEHAARAGRRPSCWR